MTEPGTPQPQAERRRPFVLRSEADFFAFIERRLREQGFEVLETGPAAHRAPESLRHA